MIYLKGYANERYFKKGEFGHLRSHHFPGSLFVDPSPFQALPRI